jgi:hypothetical protein
MGLFLGCPDYHRIAALQQEVCCNAQVVGNPFGKLGYRPPGIVGRPAFRR